MINLKLEFNTLDEFANFVVANCPKGKAVCFLDYTKNHTKDGEGISIYATCRPGAAGADYIASCEAPIGAAPSAEQMQAAMIAATKTLAGYKVMVTRGVWKIVGANS